MHDPGWTCAVALATGLLATSAIAQVVDFSKYPDFMGQWDRNGAPNNWVVLSGPPPLTPEYQNLRCQQGRSEKRPARQLAVDLLHSGRHAGDDERL